MWIRFLLAAVLLWLTSTVQSSAAEFQLVQSPVANKRAILMSGVIARGDETVFHALAAAGGEAVVFTTGPGGSVAAAVQIGSEIRARGWATVVPEDMHCASACSMIWLAGKTRYLGAGAQIGFHAMSQEKNGIRAEDHDEDFVLRKWLSDLGYAIDATATIVNTPASSVRWYDANELRANGIATDNYPASNSGR